MAGWVVFAVALWATAPNWESVSKDDDVSFFPAGSPTVVGQGLLQRGFPSDVASSQAVVIAERRDGKLTTEDFKWIDRLSAKLANLVESPTKLGIKQVLDHRALVLGPRLVGTSPDGKSQAALTVVMLQGTYLAKTVPRGGRRDQQGRRRLRRRRAPAARPDARDHRIGGGRARHEHGVDREHLEHDDGDDSRWWSPSC